MGCFRCASRDSPAEGGWGSTSGGVCVRERSGASRLGPMPREQIPQQVGLPCLSQKLYDLIWWALV